MMKTIYKYISALFVLPLLLASCTDEDNTEYNKGNQPLEVTASTAELELDASNPTTEALKLTWTTGSNQGTNAAISYTFQMDVAGNNFAGGISEDAGRNNYEKTFRNEELNDLLVKTWNIAPETEIDIETRVIAAVAVDGMEPITSEVKTIKIKTHKPISKTLYLLGDATPNGWDAGNATEMKPISGTAKGFSWTGNMSAGKFKLITTLGEFTPSYNKGADETKLYWRESDSDPYDEQFEITTGGTYKITLNLITKVISIERGQGPEYTNLWLVGHMTGWSFKPMTVDPLDPFVFHYNADLSPGGEFKIATVADFAPSVVFLRPEVNETAEGIDLPVVKWSESENSTDNKWKVSSGVYKVTLNTRDMKIDIKPFAAYPSIYLIGDATPAGWDINNAASMSSSNDPYQMTWEGHLSVGELKFSCDKQSDWNGDWFTAVEANLAPSGDEESMIYTIGGSGTDNKWKIGSSGTYKITLDQLKEVVTITKQ